MDYSKSANNEISESENILTLIQEDGTQVECYIIAVFDIDEKEYIALLPKEPGNEIVLFRYSLYGDDEMCLCNIDNNDEWQEAVSRLDELMEEGE